MEKKCCRCKQFLEKELFGKNSSKSDGLNSYCFECGRLYAKKHYVNNKNYHRVKNRCRRKTLGVKNKKNMDDYKSAKGCSYCIENDPSCLDFHHIDKNDKEYAVSKKYNLVNWEVLLEEIKKCIVLCSNCHRKLHAGKDI